MLFPQSDSARLALSIATEEFFGANPAIGTKAITGASNAAPIVVTVTAHGYPSGHVVNIAGVTGNTQANGIWEIIVVDANNFQLVGSEGNGAYVSGGTVKAAVMAMRFTGGGLNYKLDKKRSNEIRNDAQGSGIILTGASVDGSFTFELSYKELDWLLAGVLRNTWTVYGYRGVGAAFTGTFSATNVLTASVAPTGASAFTSLKKGQWVQVQGSSIPANNIVAQLSTSVAPTTTVLTFQGAPFANGGGGAACRIAGSRLTNGVLARPFATEEAYTDIAQIFPSNGVVADSLDLTFGAGDIVNGSIAFMGKKGAVPVAVTALDTAQPSNTFDQVNSITGVQQIQRDGATPIEAFMSLKLKIANSARKRMAVGSLGPVSIGYGRCLVSGSIEAYLTDGTRFTKFVNNTPFAFSWAAQDAAGNGYVITVPRARFNDTNPNSVQADQDVMDPGAFDAEFDSAQAAGSGLVQSIFIDRVGVAV